MGKDHKPVFFVFPAWTNHLREIGAAAVVAGLAFVGLVGAVGLAPGTTAVGYAPEQPVPYSHRLHVGELGLDCRYCHNTVEKAARAAVPPIATCMNCHATIKTKSPLLEPLRQAWEADASLPWVRVHDLPDFVYFDHSAHLSAGVSCVSCHGRVDRMDVVRQVEPLNMAWCLRCHRDPEPNLRPRERITDLAWERNSETDPVGAELAARYRVATSTDCSTCHR